MIKYIILTAFVLVGCSSDPSCPQIIKEDYKTGIFSRKLGSVDINGEQCQIFEQYRKTNCIYHSSNLSRRFPLNCSGPSVECWESILTRITKCPSGNTTNSITYSNDKFHVEHVQ